MISIRFYIFFILITIAQLSAQFDKSDYGTPIVSNMSGSLMYNYPISRSSVDGYSINVDLNYVENVKHIYYDNFSSEIFYNEEYYLYGGATLYQYRLGPPSWKTLENSRPLWIFGVNGFAVQVLEFKKDFIYKRDNGERGNESEYLFVIPGYDYTNDFEYKRREGYRDKIMLLKSDGSVLTLKNSQALEGNLNIGDSILRVGYYYEETANTNAYGLVSFDTTFNYSQNIKTMYKKYYSRYSLIDEEKNSICKPRKLCYYPGDGLEYVFHEFVFPFGYNPLHLSTYEYAETPTIFYLTSINSAENTICDFNYTKMISDDGDKIPSGRALLKGFTNHKLYYKDNSIDIETFERRYSIELEPKLLEQKHMDYNYTYEQFLEELYDDGNSDHLISPSFIKHYYDIYNNEYILSDTTFINNKEAYFDVNFMVSKIIDPQNREIEFKYEKRQIEYTNLFVPQVIDNIGKFYLEYPLLISFKSPTSYTKFFYHRDDNKVDFTDSTYDIDMDNNLSKFEIWDNSENSLYASKTFEYIDVNTSDRKTRVIEKYFTQTKKTDYYFKNITLSNGLFNGYKHWYLAQTKEYYYDSDIEYKLTDYFYSSAFDSIPYNYYLLNKQKSYISLKTGESSTQQILTNSIEYDYYFSLTNNFSNSYYSSDILKQQIGTNICKEILKVYDPKHFPDDSLKYRVVKDYIHITNEYDKNLSSPLNIKTLDLRQTRRKRDSLVYFGYDDVVEYDYSQNNVNNRNIPPVYNLLSKESVYYKYDSLLYYQRNTYEQIIDNDDAKLGALLNQYVKIGDDAEKLLRINNYKQNALNKHFLSEIVDEDSIKTKMYYDFDIDDDGANDIIAKRMDNHDNTTNSKFFEFHPEFEVPLVIDKYVRKTNPFNGSIDTLILREAREKTYYGTDKRLMNYNGWLYQNSFDSVGRKLVAWHPYDFPSISDMSNNAKKEEKCVPFTSYRYFEKTQSAEIITNENDIQTISNFNENISEVFGELRIGNYSARNEWYNFIQTTGDTVQKQNLVSKSYSSELSYVPISDDDLHSAISIDKIELRMNLIGTSLNETALLNLRCDYLNINKWISVNNHNLVTDSSYCHDCSIITNELRIDLSDYETELLSAPLYQEIKFSLKMANTESNYEFMESKLTNTCIAVSGVYPDPAADFTYRYYYDDDDMTLNTYQKIDDYNMINNSQNEFNHTMNYQNWNANLSGYVGRYTRATSTFDVNGDIVNNINYIGSPTSTNLSQTYMGYFTTLQDSSYQWIKTFDPLGYATESILSYNQKNYTKLPDGNYFVSETRVGLPVDILEDLYDSNEEYYQYCVVKESYNQGTSIEQEYTGNKNIVREYYNGINQLIFKVKFLSNSTSSFNSTNAEIVKYNYDDMGRLIQRIEPNNDTLKMWYDKYHNVNYKYNKNSGYQSLSYNSKGQLRFSQTQKQADSNLVSFRQYDDLGRTTITGEAKIDVSANPTSVFDRISDRANPDKLAYENYNSEGWIPTVNKSLWFDPRLSGYGSEFPDSIPVITDNYLSFIDKITIPAILQDKAFMPYYNLNALGIDTVLSHQVLKKHFYNMKDTTAPINDFENIYKYPRFLRTVVAYDKLPAQRGAVWSFAPDSSVWKNMLRDGNINNPLGNRVAVAYRDHSGEPFHYAVFSYDARNRVEAVLRFTENIGFEAIYYRYNSMNKLIWTRSLDANREMNFVYHYDANGRLEHIYTKTRNKGFGDNPHYITPMDIDELVSGDPSITYHYNLRNEVIQKDYNDFDIELEYEYSSRGWIDRIIATDNLDQLFKLDISDRDINGFINKEEVWDKDNNHFEQINTYDYEHQLTGTSYKKNNTQYSTMNYNYDRMGNKTSQSKTVNSQSTNYSFTRIANSNRINYITKGNNSIFMNYDQNGAVSMIAELDNNLDTLRAEHFNYMANGLLKQYLRENISGVFDCNSSDLYEPQHFDWRYRSGLFGGREQKRLYYSPHGDGPDGDSVHTHQWEYTQKGAMGETIAIYDGIQFISDTSNSASRNVYFYPSRYIVGGGEIILSLDSGLYQPTLQIADHLGNTRMTITHRGDENIITYMPFGDTLSTTAGEEPRMSYYGEQRDYESRYITMGARLYDPDLGQFLSVDPLAEVFPFSSPYVYANNSPMNFSDPTGLAPEKDGGVRLQQVYIEFYTELMDNYDGVQYRQHNAYLEWMFFEATHNGGYIEFLRSGAAAFSISGEGGGRRRKGEKASQYFGSEKLNSNKPLSEEIDRMNSWVLELMELDNEKGTPKEWGYFIRRTEDGELFADFFEGKDEDTWLTFSDEDPYSGTDVKQSGDILLGFVHGHYSPDHFSVFDQLAISNFALGEYSWTGLPKMASFDTYVKGGTYYIKSIEVLNTNNNYVAVQRYGLVYPEGSFMIGWATYNDIGISYRNMWSFGTGNKEIPRKNYAKVGIYYWELGK